MSKLKLRSLLALIWLLALLAVGVLVLLMMPQPITIEVSGEQGRRIEGFVDVDGRVHGIDSELPVTLNYSGRKLAYAIRRADGPPDEKIDVQVFVLEDERLPCRSTGGVAGNFVVRGVGYVPMVGALPMGGSRQAQARIDYHERHLPLLVEFDSLDVPAPDATTGQYNPRHMQIWLEGRSDEVSH